MIYTAGEGSQWVALEISVRLPNDDLPEPRNDRFTLRANDQTYDPTQSVAVSSNLAESVEGHKYSPASSEPGTRTTAILVFKIPAVLSVEDMAFEYQHEPNDKSPYAVVWGESDG